MMIISADRCYFLASRGRAKFEFSVRNIGAAMGKSKAARKQKYIPAEYYDTFLTQFSGWVLLAIVSCIMWFVVIMIFEYRDLGADVYKHSDKIEKLEQSMRYVSELALSIERNFKSPPSQK